MAEQTISNNVKAALCLGKIKEFYPINKDSDTSYLTKTDMLTINHMKYSIERKPDMQGIPNGISRATELALLLKLPDDNSALELYSSINDGTTIYLSCIFNPTYDYSGANLSDFDSAFTALGNIVAIREIFQQGTTNSTEAESSDRIVIEVSVVMHSIEYITSSDPISMTLF